MKCKNCGGERNIISHGLCNKCLLPIGYSMNEVKEIGENILLAKSYESQYLFEDAIKVHQELLSKFSKYTPSYLMIAYLMVKQNRLDEAIEYLEDLFSYIKSHPYYFVNLLADEVQLHPDYLGDLRCLPIDIEELKKKKASGYIYKPRPRKNNL